VQPAPPHTEFCGLWHRAGDAVDRWLRGVELPGHFSHAAPYCASDVPRSLDTESSTSPYPCPFWRDRTTRLPAQTVQLVTSGEPGRRRV